MLKIFSSNVLNVYWSTFINLFLVTQLFLLSRKHEKRVNVRVKNKTILPIFILHPLQVASLFPHIYSHSEHVDVHATGLK